MVWDGVAKLANSVLGIFFDSPEVKAVKEEGKLEIAKLELQIRKEQAAYAAKAEADYDTKAMENMKTSWKDEYLILLHTFPIWGYGVPSSELHEGLDRIWFQFNQAGYWWWICYIGIIASTFGLRWLFNNRVDKMIKSKANGHG